MSTTNLSVLRLYYPYILMIYIPLLGMSRTFNAGFRLVRIEPHDAGDNNMEKLDLQGQPLNLEYTLTCGQAFRWRKKSHQVWRGVVRDKLMELAEEHGYLLWRTYPENDLELVKDYLRLNDDVNAIYAQLSSADPHLKELIVQFHGLRLLRQDPEETLLSFVCSAANSIPRIMAAIEELAAKYGTLVCEQEKTCYYSFPEAKTLASADRSALEKTASLAFRGSNLKSVAQQIVDHGDNWLLSLRDADYQTAKAELMTIRGVGAKMADCVSLFALNKDEAVPVDTHIRQLAQRLFLPDLKAKTVTDAVYRKVQDVFNERYDGYAGWAQQFLYYEDLLRSREIKPGRIEKGMD